MWFGRNTDILQLVVDGDFNNYKSYAIVFSENVEYNSVIIVGSCDDDETGVAYEINGKLGQINNGDAPNFLNQAAIEDDWTTVEISSGNDGDWSSPTYEQIFVSVF